MIKIITEYGGGFVGVCEYCGKETYDEEKMCTLCPEESFCRAFFSPDGRKVLEKINKFYENLPDEEMD